MKLDKMWIKFTVKSSGGGRKNWIWNLRPLSQKTSLYVLNKLRSCETRIRMCWAINFRDSNTSQAILSITSPKHLPNFRVANSSQIVHSNSTIQHDHNVNDLGQPPPLEASEFSEMSDSGMVSVSRAMKLGVCIMLPCFQIITSTNSQIFLGKISTALLHVHVYHLNSVQL